MIDMTNRKMRKATGNTTIYIANRKMRKATGNTTIDKILRRMSLGKSSSGFTILEVFASTIIVLGFSTAIAPIVAYSSIQTIRSEKELEAINAVNTAIAQVQASATAYNSCASSHSSFNSYAHEFWASQSFATTTVNGYLVSATVENEADVTSGNDEMLEISYSATDPVSSDIVLDTYIEVIPANEFCD